MSALDAELAATARLSKSGLCVSTALFVYDYLLTFEQEVRLVWRGKLSYGTILFLLLRYTGFVVIGCYYYADFAPFNVVSTYSCKVAMDMIEAVVVTVLVGGALVLALRTWAIWERSLVCGVLVALLWGAFAVASYVFTIFVIVSLISYTATSYPGRSGCGSANAPSTAAYALYIYVCQGIYEAIILTLTVIRGTRYLSNKPAPLLTILFREAFLGSACLLAVTIADAVLAGQDSAHFYIAYHIGRTFYHIVPCRIILNLRERASHVDGWDLATTQPTSISFSVAEPTNQVR